MLALVGQIHTLAPKKFKPLSWKRFRKEVSVIVVRVNERHDDLVRLNHVPHVEMPACNMFRSIMMFGII